MYDSGDALGVYRWGLKRYAWVVAVFVLLLGALFPWLLLQVPEKYEAQAQVGPTQTINLPNLDVLPRLGETVFNNGVVADAVRDSVRPRIAATQSVIPQQVELVAAQDNIVFVVVGHGPDPDMAAHVANVAAARFTQELNKYDELVGSFAIQQLATPPTDPVTQLGGTTAVGIGVLAGLAAGMGVVALILVGRRPVVDPQGVRETTGAPTLGRVSRGRSSRTRGLPQLCRLINSGNNRVLYLVGPRSTRHARKHLATELRQVLGRSRQVVWYERRGSGHPGVVHESDQENERPDLIIIDNPTQAEIATRPAASLTLLVVREGIGQAALRREADLFLDGGQAGVILVHGSRWRSRPNQQRHLHHPERSSQAPRSPAPAGKKEPTTNRNDTLASQTAD